MRWLLGLFLFLLAPLALADSCTLTTQAVSFGVYDPLSAVAKTANGSITAVCNNTPVVIKFSIGGGPTYLARRMSLGGSTLNYNLYTDAALSRIWGDGTGGSFTGGGLVQTGPGRDTVVFPIYGVIPPNQDPGLGLHSDTIVVTMVF